MNVPAAVLRQAYEVLVTAERDTRVAAPGSEASKHWYDAMRARVDFGVYVMAALETDAINVNLETV